jgi:predicted signal transduction protein with EAL and GGDEF domain
MDVLAPSRRLAAWYSRQSRVTGDLIVMGLAGLPIYLLAVWYDALDKFLEFTNEPQSDAIDWLVILFVFLGIAAKIYSVRRTIDLRHEVVRRRKAETEAYQLARYDVLTGLPNRRWFIEDFDKWSCELPAGEACAPARRRPRQFQADQRRLRPQARRRGAPGHRQASHAAC